LSLSDTQLLADGQVPSHVSPDSTTPLPQTGEQLLSLFALQVPGQHASPFAHAAIVPAFTHCRVHAVPESDRSWQLIAGHEVGQFPSQISPDSTTPLPQEGVQLLSFSELHPGGQQPSLLTQFVWVPVVWHCAAHVPPLISARWVHPIAGHDIGHDASGSHVSPLSTIELPHVAGQSTSRLPGPALHPGGQQPSAVVPLHGRVVVEQRTLQVAADPVRVVICQHCPAGHDVGHDEGGSHVSPAVASTTPSPHPAQSESFCAVHPTGQQRSLPAFEQVFALCAHTKLHVAALPVWVSVVQSFWSSHTGHDPGGSQVSPGSKRPLPHPPQSASPAAVQFAGQHPSCTVPLHVALAHGSTGGPSTLASAPASGTDTSGSDASWSTPVWATSPYFDKWAVCDVTVLAVVFTAEGKRVHDVPSATARRRLVAGTGATSAASYR